MKEIFKEIRDKTDTAEEKRKYYLIGLFTQVIFPIVFLSGLYLVVMLFFDFDLFSGWPWWTFLGLVALFVLPAS